MEPIASFSGIASGVQWRDMIDQILQVERRPARLLEQQITRTQTRSAAWLSFQTKLTAFQDATTQLADGSVFDTFSTSISGSGFKASASGDASPGSYSVEVLKLAKAEKLGGGIVSSKSSALGLSGEFWLNGSRIAIDPADTLSDIAYTINAANTGTNATRVSAGVVSAGGGYQMVLSSERTGAAGIDLAGDPALLAGLGLTDSQTSIKHATSDGAQSDGFASTTTAIGTLLGMTAPPASATINLGGAGGIDIDVDLAQDSLEDISGKINGAGGSISAAIISETVDGKTVQRLDISGTTTFTGSAEILTTLGLLEGGRGAVAQEVQSGTAFETATGLADGTTAIRDLYRAGQPANADYGDTFTISGTRADGSTFSMDLELTDGTTPPTQAGHIAVTTLEDVRAHLAGASGFGASADVSIQDGRLVVTDSAGGASQLGLSIVSHNEKGGALDFGAFDVTTVGRAREIVDGSDAAVRIDGIYSTHSTNSVSGSIPGVSLTLSAVTTEPGAVTISRDTDAVVKAVKGLVDGYNDIAAFVTDQFSGGEGSNKPLSGDSSLRGFRSRLSNAMRETLTTGVGGEWSRLSDLGVEIKKDGTFGFEESKLRDALASDPMAVERLFGVHGATSGTGIRYIAGSKSTGSGSYTVNVTQHATTALLTGTADVSGGYDPAVSGTDTLKITDLASGKTYDVALDTAYGTGQELVNALNASLGEVTTHQLQTVSALHADGIGTPAGEDTTWDQVYNGDGTDALVAEDDAITISGRRPDGTSFMETFQITEPTTQTLGDLRDRVQNLVGADATVGIDANGRFLVTANKAGSSLLELTLSYDNKGGTGALQLGTEVATEGHPAAPIQASLSATNTLQLTHQDYGSSAGLRVAFDTGNAAAAFGLDTTLDHTGQDIEGTIGGMATTGSGSVLTGAEGTGVEGLMLRIEDTFTTGSVTFSRGIGSLVERALAPMLETGTAGSIQSIIDGLDERVTTMNDRIDALDVRLDRRRESLIRRFTAMEQAMAIAQNQSSWLMSQIGSLPGSYSSNAK